VRASISRTSMFLCVAALKPTLFGLPHSGPGSSVAAAMHRASTFVMKILCPALGIATHKVKAPRSCTRLVVAGCTYIPAIPEHRILF
jgi:hypothetical protein